MKRRTKSPADVEANVLIHSRRRCCLCVFLEKNFERRKGQVAHLDQDPGNNDPDNLAFLCFDHHDEYDSRTRQTKNFTLHEVKEYRKKLHQIVDQEEIFIAFPSNSREGDAQLSAMSSGRLLGRILEAFDREVDELSRHSRPNGIALSHLATVAAKHEGDFRAAGEAFILLIRLAGEARSQGRQLPSFRSPVPDATPLAAAVHVLQGFFRLDFSLTLNALRRSREVALLGDTKFQDLDVYRHQIAPSFFPVAQILCWVGRVTIDLPSKWAAELVGRSIAGLVLSSAMLLRLQGISIPAPPSVIRIDITGERVSGDSDERIESFVWAANRMAMLASPAFSAAIEAMKFSIGISEITSDENDGIAVEDLRAALVRWAVFPGHAMVTGCRAKTAEEATECEQFRSELKTIGVETALEVAAWVKKERELILDKANH